VKKRGGVG